MFFLISAFNLKAQTVPDLLAHVYLKDITMITQNTIEFDMRILRPSDRWYYWANGTFEFTLDQVVSDVAPANYLIEYIDQTTDLAIQPFPGQLPEFSYLVTPRVLQGRFSITVVGPETWNYCTPVPADSNGIRIGRFRIIKTDSTLIELNLKWLTPYYYYQACAYKSKSDSVINQTFNFAYAEDDVEMDNGYTTKVEYDVLYPGKPSTAVQNFRCNYLGGKKMELTWETASEYNLSGFIVARGINNDDVAAPDVIYTDTVADYRKGYPPHSDIKGSGFSKSVKKYSFIYDSVPYRGYNYCYELMYMDGNNVLHSKLAYSCCVAPHSVIVWSQGYPNPFSVQTNITYLLDDDVMLTCKVFDTQGKLVTTLIDNEFRKKGQWEVVFNAPALAQQGLYDVIFVATPIDDPTVEISKAVVKIQLLK